VNEDSNPGLSLTQIAAVIGVALAVYFLVDLGRMAWENVLLRRMVVEQQQKNAQVQSEIQTLESAQSEVNRGESIERWARGVRGLVREGDVPIVVYPPVADRSSGEIMSHLTPAEAATPRPHWREWWDLFASP
jgi:cell division protein FtsB